MSSYRAFDERAPVGTRRITGQINLGAASGLAVRSVVTVFQGLVPSGRVAAQQTCVEYSTAAAKSCRVSGSGM